MEQGMKSQWVEALRSGKYKQCQGQLCDGTGYCCLGVLIDVATPGSWIVDYDSLSKGIENGIYGNTEDFMPEPKLFDAMLGVANEVINYERLAGMNDNGSNFSEIADYIEENL